MNKALDNVRAGETSRMKREERAPVLRKSRWLLLRRSENLGVDQHFRLRDLLRHNLKTARAYLPKEAFQQLWEYSSPSWADKFLDEWRRQTMRSGIEPMKKIARSLRNHRELILNYFRAQKLLAVGSRRGGLDALNFARERAEHALKPVRRSGPIIPDRTRPKES